MLFISAISFCDFSMNSSVFSVLLKSCRKDSFVRVILELLNVIFDCISAIRVLLLDRRVRYARNPVIDASATGFPVTLRFTLVVTGLSCLLDWLILLCTVCRDTHLLHAQFLHIQRAQSHLYTSHACHIHAWLKGVKKFIAHVSFLSISPSLVSCFTRLCCSLMIISKHFPDSPHQHDLAVLPVLNAQDKWNSAKAKKQSGYLAKYNSFFGLQSLADWTNKPPLQGVRQNDFCGQ